MSTTSSAIKKYLKKKGATKTRISTQNSPFLIEQKALNAMLRTRNLENAEIIVLEDPIFRTLVNAPRGIVRPKKGNLQTELRKRQVRKTLNKVTPLPPNMTRKIAAKSVKPKQKKPLRR